MTICATLRKVGRLHGRQIVLFLLAGALTTVIYLGIFAFLVDYRGVNYRIGITIAYPFAVLFHYVVNYYVTFRLRHSGLTAGLRRYVWLVAINYILNLAVLELCVRAFKLPPTAGALAGIVVTFAVSYVLAKQWVFREREPAQHKAAANVSERR